jgi:hypothetical protein
MTWRQAFEPTRILQLSSIDDVEQELLSGLSQLLHSDWDNFGYDFGQGSGVPVGKFTVYPSVQVNRHTEVFENAYLAIEGLDEVLDAYALWPEDAIGENAVSVDLPGFVGRRQDQVPLQLPHSARAVVHRVIVRLQSIGGGT